MGALRIDVRRLLSPIECKVYGPEHPTDFKITYLFLLFPLPLCPLHPLRLRKKLFIFLWGFGEAIRPTP